MRKLVQLWSASEESFRRFKLFSSPGMETAREVPEAAAAQHDSQSTPGHGGPNVTPT